MAAHRDNPCQPGFGWCAAIDPWLVRSLVTLVTDQSLTNETMQTVTRLAVIALIAYVGRGIMQFLRIYLAHIAGWGCVSDARKFVYEHLQKLSLRFYEDKQTGQLMSRVVNDTDLFERMISMPSRTF